MSTSPSAPSSDETGAALHSTLRRRREALGLSQQALGETVGVSRQAILAIEAGRQVPSTALGLRLSHALGCTVEDLFSLIPAGGLAATLAPDPGAATRVAVAELGGRWIAHRLPADPTVAADGIVTSADATSVRVRPLVEPDRLRRNVLVAGCAPVLGALAPRVGGRFGDARATWLAAGSARALNLLGAGLVHVAGVHYPDVRGEDNLSTIRRAFPGASMLLANLTRWRQGLVVAEGNPLDIRSGADLLRPGLRFARREEGTGAEKLARRLVEAEGVYRPVLSGPLATGHVDVARLVACGAADVGVAVEGVALAAGLDFVPISEERFDLVIPAGLADRPPVSRLLDALDDPAFRAELASIPGYDGELAGHVTTLEAA